jgi:phenylacetate-CoA ligase
MYPFIAENIIYPVGDLALGTSVMRYYRWFQKTQWWSPERLVELQNEKLKNLIKHAYTNVPYYRNMFDTLDLPLTGIQNVQDLGKLPILTRDKIRANTEQFTATDFKKYKPIPGATGGSTGNPLKYYITKDLASINWAGMFRGFGWEVSNRG